MSQEKVKLSNDQLAVSPPQTTKIDLKFLVL